jgi:hypothetical protein
MKQASLCDEMDRFAEPVIGRRIRADPLARNDGARVYPEGYPHSQGSASGHDLSGFQLSPKIV